MNKSCMTAGDKTFPHEMGHYLNLPHTFETGGGIEFVDGSNCATAGDGFCDTPADFVDYRAPCPYTGDSVDPKGDLYRTVIDETLLMSYFSDNCVNRFSNEQMAEMNWALTNKRSYLLNRPMPDVTPLDSVVFTAPASVPVTFTSSSYTFKWNSVPRAQYYRLRVQSATSSQAIVDTLIRDTTYTVTNFFVNKTYKFRVKAISYGNTCGDNANYQPLSFTMPTGVNDLDAKVSMKIFPNPANDASVLNLQVALNEKAEAVISLFNLNGQMIQQMHRSFIEGTNNMQINIEELSSGMYFIQLKSNDAIKTERVSIIR